MASGPITGDDGVKEKRRFIENKVYTRKGVKKKSNVTANNIVINNINNNNNNNNVDSVTTPSTNDTVNTAKNSDTLKESPEKTLGSEDANLAQQLVVSRGDVVVSEDSSSLNRQQQVVELATPSTPEVPVGNSNGVVKTGLESQAEGSLVSRSKQDKRELRRKLKDELVRVRSLVTRIEAKEREITESDNLRVSNAAFAVNDGLHNEIGGGLTFVNSEVASAGVPRVVNRPLNQLRVPMLENNQVGGEIMEKEKRTPKANPLYKNSEFLLAKDKFPPAESNKKSKSHHKKHGGGELGNAFGMGSKCFKNCCSLLEKLMKHKHGWVFNAPVDPQALGLHDYFTIIKHPMDLGSIKLRLQKHLYKSPKEFADDVRLTFYNAMRYNPKGQDVHVMAEQLLRIFEDRWATIESDYNRETRFGLDHGTSLYSLPSRLAPPPRPPPLDMQRILERSESMMPMPKPMMITTPSSRTPAPKKPKAKDPQKRDMTYEEKQKLSTNLQSLPPEKLDNIVQIIRKRNSAVFQQDDEIEVDIDSVDAETLWELDRFVTNHKKVLSKKKRKAELDIQARVEAGQNVQYMASTPTMAEAPKETRTDDRHVSASSPVQGRKQGDTASESSSSSSSSSSDSGSSSSDSDSDSSSASRSDAENSPRT